MSHLKRLYAPKSWGVKRKGIKFIVRPSPGPHSLKSSIPLTLVFRDLLKIASNLKEVRYILLNNNVLVDGIRRKDHKFPVGIFDIIEIQETKEIFRVIFDKRKIGLLKIDKNEANLKLCKIIGKKNKGKKVQLNLYDGKNILVDKDTYKVGDTIAIEVPKNIIKNHLKLEKGNLIYLTGGKHVGVYGKVVDISGNKIKYKSSEGIFETLKEYAFVVGIDKPLISIKGEQ
jgi:small subunit ribosomal protein S4e